MSYMESLPKRVNIQHRVSGDWVTLEENVGLGGYLEFLKRCPNNHNYRVIDDKGHVVNSPAQRIDSESERK